MRVICTGTSGTERIGPLRGVARRAAAQGQPVEIFDVREAMFQIAADVGQPVDEDTILDMFPRALVLLRAAALEKIASLCEQASQHPNWIINTHAVFRWKNTLIPGFDSYYLRRLKPDVYVTITSGVQIVRERLRQHPRWQDLTIEDLLVWREEEQFSTEEMARIQRKPQYLLGRSAPEETLYRLLFEPRRRKVYLSYPMAHVEPGAVRRLAHFRRRLEEEMIVFDPSDVNDFAVERNGASRSGDGAGRLEVLKNEGQPTVDDPTANGPTADQRQPTADSSECGETARSPRAIGAADRQPDLSPRELQHISDQIVFRDYKLITQSDFVVVFYDIAVPSPGVVSEMNQALHSGKRVYGVWLPDGEPSPFFTRYCTRSFRSEDELFQYFARYRISKPPAPSWERGRPRPHRREAAAEA
jgi:adenylate kinase